ncbi:Kinesin motor domain containing protein [Novymonas esmeraldas]|uniref:Kinesin motor domain containing protein n=1 Tax=Novymonas esmeraldas TaxID=1808958 RepID=A0AAW0EQL9_9TRYP
MAELFASAPPPLPHPVAERIHVYGRVRPPASPDARVWVTVDSANTTLHCGSHSDHGDDAAPPRVDGVAGPRRPHRTTAPAAASSSFTLDGIVGDVRRSAAQLFLDSTARACVADCLMLGTSATVLCCGEKSAGKTTTLFGDAAVPGLCHRILGTLYTAVAAQTEAASLASSAAAPTALLSSSSGFAAVQPGREEAEEARRGRRTRYLVQLSCLALKGEHLVDLVVEAAKDAAAAAAAADSGAAASARRALHALEASSTSAATKPAISIDQRGEVVLRNVSKTTCRSAADAMALVDRARRVTSTSLASAHVIVMVDVTCEEGEEGNASHHVLRTAQLYLVDLAAAQHPQQRGQRQTPSAQPPGPPPLPVAVAGAAARTSPAAVAGDAAGAADAAHRSRADDAAIRHSLAMLQEVVLRLSSSSVAGDAAPSAPPPYKQSKLTMLLKGHLGGGCRTLVLAHVRAEESYKAETLATLRQARRLLCVPERPVARAVEDPAVMVRQLQRQVAALQAELRLQMEMSAHAASTALAMSTAAAAEAAAAAAAASAAAGDLGSTGNGRAAKRRAGDGASKAAAPPRSSNSPGGHSSTHSPAPTPAPSAEEYRPLTHRHPASSATPASAPWMAAVRSFIAGHIAVLPVLNITDMHTCFELLRQCVVERDIQLGAALADLRAADAAAAAAAAQTAAAASASARSSVSERYTGRSVSAARSTGSGGGAARRRAGSMRGGSVSSAKDPSAATEGKQQQQQQQPSSTDAAAVPSAAAASQPGAASFSSRTTLLRELSPSVPASAQSRTGRGYGSAPPAAGPSRESARDTAPPTPAQALATLSPTRAAAAAGRTNAPPAWQAQRVVTPDNEGPFSGGGYDGAASSPSPLPPPPSLVNARTAASAPSSRVRPSSASPGRTDSPSHASVKQRGWTLPDSLELPPSNSTATSITLVSSAPAPRPHTAPPTPAAPAPPQASPREASAFHVYATQVPEGVQQVQHIRQEEGVVAGLRRRVAALASVNGGGRGHHSAETVMDECRHHEAQLARRREALLHNFEGWYRTRVMGNSGAAGPHASAAVASAQPPPSSPLGRAGNTANALTLGAMRRRLLRPATAGGGAAANGGGGRDAQHHWKGSMPVLRHAAAFSSRDAQHDGSGEALLTVLAPDATSTVPATSFARA